MSLVDVVEQLDVILSIERTGIKICCLDLSHSLRVFIESGYLMTQLDPIQLN